MNIGILTFHNSLNFGANLQTLATQSMLNKAGVSATVLDYRDEKKASAFATVVSPEQLSEHQRFGEKYYNLSPVLKSRQELEEFCRDSLDGVLVGSDAVFRIAPKYQPSKIIKKLLGRDRVWAAFASEDELSPYWLRWDKGHRSNFVKASIAASSRGTSFYFLKADMYPKLWKSINDFDFISTRDDWTRFMVKMLSLGRQDPVICPDPVFGLNSGFTFPAEEKPDIDLSKTILLSGDFDREWFQNFKQGAHEAGYKVGTLPNPEMSFDIDGADFCIPLPLSPLAWYKMLSDCAGYIGIRFHALVSCVANRTPVVTIDVAKKLLKNHDSRNPNFDLCKRAGIRRRYFLRSQVLRENPKNIFEILFDEKTQSSADCYAEKASEDVNMIIRQIVDKCTA